MAFVSYTGLKNPDDVLSAISTYVSSQGYFIAQPITDDLNIYDRSSSDGKRFCFQNPSGDYFIILRTASGTQVFGDTNDSAMDIKTPETDSNYVGIAMTVSEGYSTSARWYNQYHVPKQGGGVKVYGVFMPIAVGENYSYTLYCNSISNPTETIVFTLVKENDSYKQCAHLLYANINKYDNWEGGAFFSGSCPISMMKDGIKCWLHEQTADRYILPICSSGTVSNSFLRIDIDEAPLTSRGNILWASSGTANETGKKLALPIRTADNLNGKIPHYYYLQSKDRLDWGKNICTLNAITINLPIFLAVMVDPDILDNYSAVGHISGVYFVSNLNMQTGCVYEISYPESNKLCQVFPACGKRRGAFGFDGISIQQFIDEN